MTETSYGEQAMTWASTAWDVVTDFFEQARVVPLWEWLLDNPSANELGNLTGVLWTVLLWNLIWLCAFRLLKSVGHPRLKLVLVAIYVFFSMGIFVLSQTTRAVVARTRSVPGASWLGDQVLLVWLFVFLALFLVLVLVGTMAQVIGKVAWLLNLVLLWVVYAVEASVYATEWTVWGLAVMALLSGLWLAANMMPSPGGK